MLAGLRLNSYAIPVRVPIILALPLALITMSLVWWWGVRDKNFLTLPNDDTLVAVRQRTHEELKAPESITSEDSPKAIKVKPKKLALPGAEATAETQAAPIFDLGDLTIVPGLDCYLSQAEKGAEVMFALASALESKGELQRSLLAWERVLDATAANPEQQEIARKSTERLRPQLPLWNVDPLAAQTLILCVSCDRERSKSLEPILEEVARQLNLASSGLIACKIELKAGPAPSANAPRQPVALWFRGHSADAEQSKILTIPVLPAAAEEQQKILMGNIYKLIRDAVHARTPLVEWQPSSDPVALLHYAITRRSWVVWGLIFAGKS